MPSLNSALLSQLVMAQKYQSLKINSHPNLKWMTSMVGDGWCMLYAVQFCLAVEHNTLLTIDQIRGKLIEHVTNQPAHPGLASVEGNKCIGARARSGQIDKWFSDKNNADLFGPIFLLLDYLENKKFNSTVVDLLPFYLSDALQLKIHIYDSKVHSVPNSNVPSAPVQTFGDSSKEVSILLAGAHYWSLTKAYPKSEHLDLGLSTPNATPMPLAILVKQFKIANPIHKMIEYLPKSNCFLPSFGANFGALEL